MPYDLTKMPTPDLRQFVAAGRVTVTKETDPEERRRVRARLTEAEEELSGRR